MTHDEFRDFLAQHNCTYDERSVQNATQFRCHTGEIFTVYDSGKIVVGGESTQFAVEVKSLPKLTTTRQAVRAIAPVQLPLAPKDVFVVYGRDTAARDELELSIRRMG